MKITLDNLYDSGLDAETTEIVRDILETVGPLGFRVDDFALKGRDSVWIAHPALARDGGFDDLVHIPCDTLLTPKMKVNSSRYPSCVARERSEWFESLKWTVQYLSDTDEQRFEAALLLKALQGIKR
jgi:hypothetical protein